jgi:hypothetical protein
MKNTAYLVACDGVQRRLHEQCLPYKIVRRENKKKRRRDGEITHHDALSRLTHAGGPRMQRRQPHAGVMEQSCSLLRYKFSILCCCLNREWNVAASHHLNTFEKEGEEFMPRR